MARKHPWQFTSQRNGQGEPLEFVMGIPARDLTADDVAALGEAEYALVEASPLYVTSATVKPVAPVKEDAGGN